MTCRAEETDAPAVERLFLAKMAHLRHAVACLRDVYDAHPWLNDEFNISRLVPMSIDEWEGELSVFLEDPHGYGEKR